VTHNQHRAVQSWAGRCKMAGFAFGFAFLGISRLWAQLTLLGSEPQPVFSGRTAQVNTIWRNDQTKEIEVQVRTRVYQASSATATAVMEQVWKQLQVLPGQTVLEYAQVEFPPVKAETRFIIQWIDGTNHVLGKTEVLAYPADLLQELKALGGDRPIGVFDPQNQMKPLLTAANVEFADLAESDFVDFQGKLAVIGPFKSKAGMPEDLAARIKTVAQRRAAVVWIQPPTERRKGIKPSFYSVSIGKGTVVVAQAALFEGLSSNPGAQLNLIRMAQLALRPEPLGLPQISTEREENL